MNPEDTLRLAQQLDPRALAEIHDQYYPVVYRYVRYHLEDELACEDIAAEVFLRLLSALHQHKGPNQNIRAWLLGTASHLVNDHLRVQYHHKIDSLEDFDPVVDQNIEDDTDKTWDQNWVRTAIRRLTADQQQVLALRFGEEYSLEETARLMGKTIGAIKTMQFRALSTLRRLMSERQKV